MSKNDQKVIYPDDAPNYYREWGFSPAVECQGFIFVSGCTGTFNDGTVPEDIADQTRQAFKRINASLEKAGAGLSDIVEMTTYHVGLSNHLEKFIEVKDEFISEPYPAWTAIGVTELASKGAIVEIRVIAKSKAS